MTPKQKLNTREAAAYLGIQPNTREAAAYLGIQPNTLEVWRCKHKGPRYSKLGTRVLYDKADLDEFFASRSIETLESARRDRRYRNQ